MANSILVDAAILDLLNGDDTLLELLPNGVWFDEAPEGSTRFGIVRLLDHKDDQSFGNRSHEEAVYEVTALVRTTEANAGPTMGNGAARMDELLEGAMFTVDGYVPMACYREGRVRRTDPDVVDPTIRYMRCGGTYRVVMSTE